MTALGKLVRTTAFKLTLFFFLVFGVGVLVTLGYVAWNAARLLHAQMISTIEAEITGLADQYRIGGVRRLAVAVESRSSTPGASLYLLTTSAGERIAGNVATVPEGILDRPGQGEIEYGRSDDDIAPHLPRAMVRVFILPGGYRLLVGRDMEERQRLRQVTLRALGWSLLLVGLIGGLGGWFLSKRVLRRIDAMSDTARVIMAGDLGGRLAIAGTGDEIDRLAESLNAMLDRIGELMQGMRQVSDNIAHDLKTPLTRLRNHADQALRTARSEEELRAALEGAIEESDNLIRIFNALLMIARLEAGNAPAESAPVDAAEVARGMAELYEAVAEESGIGMEASIEGPLPVLGNRELLGQALANLLDNALKHGAAGGSVTIAARTEGNEAVITVADRGPGIPAPDRERVLERFVRLEAARTRPGFGLGLSLAAAVARLHGGTIRLEDNAPGLRVVLVLPLAPAAAADPPGRLPPGPASAI